MCDSADGAHTDPTDPTGPYAVSRRDLLRGAAGLVAAIPAIPALSLLSAESALAAVPAPTATPTIRPRSAWAGTTSPPVGSLPAERAGNVKFLLVHHTSSPGNDYTAAQVPGRLRGIYGYHTGTKGWPDIAYNFFVDRYGRTWEGRQGSLTRPVIPSATGGTQGYSQIACFLGDHTTTAPTPAAQSAMISLLAWLARRYDVDTAPGTTVSFVSRGSNRWPAGSRVTTRTIEGHRAMSQTTCPGNAAYALVRDSFPAAVTRTVRAQPAPQSAQNSAAWYRR